MSLKRVEFVCTLIWVLTGCDGSVPPPRENRVVLVDERVGNSDKAIIFVHGIWGSSDTWKNSDANVTWPQLIARDELFDEYDIYRVDYHTQFWSANQTTTMDVATGLHDELKKRIVDKYDRVFFVCHSMGGNIVRQYVTKIKLSEGHASLGKYRRIFFLGTPVKGSSIAAIGKLVSNDPKLRDLQPQDGNTYLESLNDGWKGITVKRTVANYPSLRIYAAYEKIPMSIVGEVIVGFESAVHLAAESKGFDKDHSELAKPKDHSDPVYTWVRERILGDEHDG